MIRTVLTSALVLAGVFGPASAETITVCAKGCDYTSINAAIAASSDGDVIQLAAETYFEGAQIDPIDKAITLRGVLGEDGEPASVLDGSGAHRVLHCNRNEDANTKFERLVIRNGSDDIGGGMAILGGTSPTLTNCTFTNNSASIGGGMSIVTASPTLINCTFTNNSAQLGRDVHNIAAQPNLANCTFTECCGVSLPWSYIDLGGNNYDSWCDDCRADLDCYGGGVDASDLGYLLARWGTQDAQSDINGDGLVDSGDLGLLIAAWGPCT